MRSRSKNTLSYQATGGLQTAVDIAKIGLDVVKDPYLPELTCQVLRLAALERGQNPGPPCVRTKAAGTGGIGLRYALVPVRLAVKVREQPIVTPLVVGGVVAGIFALGYLTGRGGR